MQLDGKKAKEPAEPLRLSCFLPVWPWIPLPRATW